MISPISFGTTGRQPSKPLFSATTLVNGADVEAVAQSDPAFFDAFWRLFWNKKVESGTQGLPSSGKTVFYFKDGDSGRPTKRETALQQFLTRYNIPFFRAPVVNDLWRDASSLFEKKESG